MKHKKLFWFSLVPTFFILAVMAFSSVALSYFSPPDDSGAVTGVTYLNNDSTALKKEAYRIDFQVGNWSIKDVKAAIATERAKGSTIASNKNLEFDPDGEVYDTQRYAYLANGKWIDFGICSDPQSACYNNRVRVDLDLTGPLAGTGDAYWSGRAYWSESENGDVINDGWITFDWNCDKVEGKCSIEDRVRTDLETEVVSGYAYSPELGWLNFRNSKEAKYTVLQDLLEVEEVEGCTSMEDLNDGDVYHVGDTFVDSGVTVEAMAFQWSDESWTSAGETKVKTGTKAGGSGNDLMVNNISLDFDFGASISGLTMNFGEYGGNLNLKVNDELRNFNNFADIDGVTIGDVTASVTNGNGNDKGSLTLDGTISTFIVGGQELYVDDICSAGEVETILVQPIVTLTPDPEDVTKYGQGGGEGAPLADGEDYYSLSVRLLETGSMENLTDDYDVSIEVTPTEDSFVYRDQVTRLDTDLGAIVFDDVAYSPSDEAFKVRIRSWAPTSNVNGYDQDADGDMDYYFDHDPEDASGYARSDVANKYEIASIDITVTGDDEVEFIALEEELVAPLWGLTEDQVDLKFAPAIEITNLGRESGEAMDYSIPSVPDEAINLNGLVTVWSEVSDFQELSFTVNSTLNSGAYYYLFDSNSNGNFVPDEDGAFVASTFTPGGMTPDTDLISAFNHTGYYVPVDGYDRSTGLGSGSAGGMIQKTMLVNADGYQAAIAAVHSKEPFFSKLARWMNPFLKANALAISKDTSRPDLTITNIYRDGGNEQLVVVVENIGDDDVVTYQNDPYIYIYIDSVREWTYSYSTLADQSFLSAGGSSEIRPQVLDDEALQYVVEACVDPRDYVNESDEDNNCYKAQIESEQLYSDLIISSIYRDDSNNQLVIEQMNTGEGDVTSEEGNTYIWIDGILSWTYSWSTLSEANKEFMIAGQSSEIRPETLTPDGDHSVQACIDYNGEIEESDENNNCTFAVIGAGADVDPLYDPYIGYAIADEGVTFTVRYYTHYMPLTAGGTIGYNVPAYDTKAEADISGSVTSSESFGADSGIENVGGEFDTDVLRNQLYQRYKQIAKGAGDPGGGAIYGAMHQSGGAELMGGDVLFFTGDVMISALEDDYNEKTIIVEGGNVFIDDNLSGQSSTGLLVFRDATGNGGNVYVHPDVTDILAVNLFADGGLYSYDGDSDNITQPDYLGYQDILTDWDFNTRQETLTNQLAWTGSIIADNTVAGASDLSAMTLPSGESTSDRLEAAESSLSDLRTFVACWVQTDEYGTPVDIDEDGYSGYDASGDLDYGDMEDCEGFERAAYFEYDGDLENANNTPFYLEYVPPSSTLPVFVRES